MHWAREQQYSAVLKLYIYRCTLDAICRIYISLQYAAYIYSCWRQYAQAENICVRLLPLSLVHILPNNLPQFGILWQYAGAENICVREIIGILNNLFCCIAHSPGDNFPNFAICNICNMLIWSYWHFQKLLLHILQFPPIAK